MGAACGKPKPYKQPDSKQVLDKAQLSTHDNISRNNTLATQQETKNFPISQTTLQNDSEKFPEREKTSSQRKNSISKIKFHFKDDHSKFSQPCRENERD